MALKNQLYRILFCSTIFSCTHVKLFGQIIPSASTFYERAFTWNPAMTAQWDQMEITLNHRKDWVDFEGAPTTSSIGFQIPLSSSFFKSKASFGAYIEQDKIGVVVQNKIQGTYTYKLTPRLFNNRKDVLALGFLAGIQHQNFDRENIVAFDDNSFDPIISDTGSQFLRPNFSLGIYYRSNQFLYKNSDHYYFGASLNRLLPFSISSGRLTSFTNNIYAHLNIGMRKVTYNSNLFLEPSIIINYASLTQFNVIGSFRLEDPNSYWMMAGLSRDEVFFQAGFILNQRSFLKTFLQDAFLRIGVKTDYNFRSLRNYSGLGYSFFLAYQYDIE